MTLPSSGDITTTAIAAEIGGFPFDIPSTAIRNLTGRPAGNITMPNDFYGQTGGGAADELSINSGDTVGGVVTLAGIAIGATAWNRQIFLLVHWSCDTSAVETGVNSGTIGGVAATVHVTYGEGGTSVSSNYGCAIVSATVPTGTTATIALTFTDATVRSVYVSVYRVTGLVSTVATDSNVAFDETVGAGTLSATTPAITFPANSLAFFAATASTAGVFGNFSSTVISELKEQDMARAGHLINGMRRGVVGSAGVNVSGAVNPTGRLRVVAATFVCK